MQGINPNFTIQYPFFEATKAGFQEAWIQSRLTLDLFTSLVSRLVVPKDAGERKAAMDSVG